MLNTEVIARNEIFFFCYNFLLFVRFNHSNIKLQKIYEFISETTSKSDNKRTETTKSKNSNNSPINALKTKQPKTNDKYKLDTKGCKIGNWPLFDTETRPLYKNLSNGQIRCKTHEPIIKVKRVDSTWIQLDWSKLEYKPFCYISELRRGDREDSVLYGKYNLYFISIRFFFKILTIKILIFLLRFKLFSINKKKYFKFFLC